MLKWEDFMKLAASAYPASWHTSWDSYRTKILSWVKSAADAGADLCVFPEYAGLEIASIGGPDVASARSASMDFAAAHIDRIADIHAEAARMYNIYVLSGSAPAKMEDVFVNRTGLFCPNGDFAWQDKQIMTRFEREEWCVDAGGPLQIFETPLGNIGILICYDSEFPLLGHALRDVDILLVPSCTEATSGYWRVRIGAMARALENQCVAVMSSLLSDDPRFYGIDEATGAGGIFCPPDLGFPANGILALGDMGHPGWTIAEIDTDQIQNVRKNGVVLNRAHWIDQKTRCEPATRIALG
jgi:predicted amidohydrolase